MKRGLHLGLPSKIFLVCAGQALFVSVIGSAMLYHGATHALREQVREELKQVPAVTTQVDASVHSPDGTGVHQTNGAPQRIESQLRNRESALLETALLNLLLAMITAMILSLIVARFAMRPIKAFSAAAERIRSGDLDFELHYEGSEELSNIATSVNGMIAGLKSSRELLLEQSTRDFMTGLYSHRYLHERLATEIARSARYSRNLCLLLIDLDRFKTINDTFGHPVGDSILQQLGAELKSNLRSIDIPARYGGDVFAVILPETDREGGMLVAHRIRKAMESRCFHAVPIEQLPPDPPSADDEHTASLTVTIGFAYYPDDHDTKDGLLMAADIALCRAKHGSRNSICAYDSSANGEEQIDPQDLYQMLRDPNIAAIRSLAAAVDAKDQYTSGHSERVAGFAVRLAEAIGMDEDMLNTVRVAGLLHDLGKIGVPDAILNKPGSLTQDEFESLRQHPSVGGNIAQRAPQLDQIIPAILHHHERYDGRGYPNGLCGEDIPLIARIMAVADSFDAMTSDRPYRQALSLDTALRELEINAGTQFDPGLVEAFLRSITEEQDAAA